MLLVFDQKACELRRKDNVVWRILFFGAIHHFVFLAAMDVRAFDVKPAILLGGKWGDQQDLFVCTPLKSTTKRWINHRQEKKIVRASDFPFPKHFQDIVRGDG